MKRSGNERGIALLMVITCLFALMVIAVPFAITMRLGLERSEAHNARNRAQQIVDSTIRFLEASLVRTTERVEIERFNQQIIDVTADPECDPQSEIEPSLMQLADTLGLDPAQLQDPYGVIVGWSVEDENGKLNINNCSPYALGNLLGMSPLSAELTETASEIQLEDTSRFPARGYVKVGRELIKYTGKSGNALTGCERNIASVLPENKRFTGEGDENKTGRMCINYAAWAISYYAVSRHRGEYTRFDGLDVSDISRLAELDPEIPVLTKAEWEKVLPFVTAWSRGESADTWSNAQPIQEGTILPQAADTYDTFLYGNSYFYNSGTLLRISERVDVDSAAESVRTGFRTADKARRMDYAMCFDTIKNTVTESRMRLYGKVHRKFGESMKMVESLVRQPVNINTAPREVLKAIFTGLVRRNRLEGRVTPEMAGKLADRIIERRTSGMPLRSFKQFRALLNEMQNKENVLTQLQVQAIYRNAVNSHDNELEFGTVPICFRTFDVYTLRASATINDRGGRQLAKHSSTRVVEIGSQVTATRMWSTQRDFEQQLVTVNDARYWNTGPFNTGWFVGPNIEPKPRWFRQLNRNLFPNDPYAHDEKRDQETERTSQFGQVATEGQIMLSTARMMYDMVGPQLTELRPVEHFDRSDYAEGEWVDDGITIPPSAGLSRTRNDELMLPFYVEFWWQPAADATGDTWLFDTAESDFRNRVTCYVDGENSELVFAVSDNTETERACELRAPLDEIGGIVQRVWYHVALCATGCNPSEMQMWVDGRALGRHNIMSSLVGNVQPDSASIGVETTEGFPEQGALLIGNEVIEYESASGGEFVVRTIDGDPIGRGQRGTLASDHLEGTPVVLFGYSRTLMSDALTGTGQQVGDLGPWNVVRFDTPAQMALLDPNAGGGGAPFQNYQPPVVSNITWQVQSASAPGGPASPLNTPLVPLQGNPNATPPTTITPFLIPFEADGSISGFGTLKYSPNTRDSWEETEDEMRGFQEDGYCYVIYTGGTQDDWTTFIDGGADNIRAVAEFMRYTYDGTSASGGLTLTRLSGNDGSQTARERGGDWYMLAGYTRVNGQDASRFLFADILIVPVSYKANGITQEGFINPVSDEDYTHWFAQVLVEDDGVAGGNEEPWEWLRYSEVLDSDIGTFLLQAYFPNEALLTDKITNENWTPSYVQALKTPLPTAAVVTLPNSSTASAANYVRFRGIQTDRNRNGLVDDWWGAGEEDADDQVITDGAQVLPVHTSYGGPDPDTGLGGEDYAVWPLPGRLDLVDLVSGDDEIRAGQLRVQHGMDGLSNRLYEDTDGNGGGDEPPVDFGIEGRHHLFAMTDNLEQEIKASVIALDDPGGNADDPRRLSRLVCFPSGEMPDNLAAMTPPALARSYTGEVASGVIDEISMEGRESNFRLVLVNETLGEEETELVAVGEQGMPEDDDIPDHPGILKIGEELAVFTSAESLGNQIQFNGLSRGMMRTVARAYERGTPMEVLFGPIVGVLSEGISDSSNQFVGEGFDRFPYMGCVRIEVPEADVADLRLYTVNKGGAIAGPIGDRGTGLFNARYGSKSMPHESGTPIFFHPVRYWDRYARYSDHATLSFWAFHAELTDAYVKRIYWKEGRAVQRAQFRVFVRLDDGIGWNASERKQIYRSRLGDSSGQDIEGSRGAERARYERASDKKGFLFVMENGKGDNFIGLQASKIDVRVFAVYRQFAFTWNNPLEIGWKATPEMQEFGIEYLQQNRVRRHIDK